MGAVCFLQLWEERGKVTVPYVCESDNPPPCCESCIEAAPTEFYEEKSAHHIAH